MKNEIIHRQELYVPAKDVNAEKLTSYTNIFKAFSSLSNAQEMMAQMTVNERDTEEANDAYNFINEAKQLLQASISQTDEDLEIYRQAMFLGMFTDA